MQDVERETVDRVARAICDILKAALERHAPEVLEHLDLSPEYWTDVATAAISAMTPDLTDKATAWDACIDAGEKGFDRGWNAAIEAAAEALCGYIHPDHKRLPGEMFASAQVRQLKKDTGNLALSDQEPIK